MQDFILFWIIYTERFIFAIKTNGYEKEFVIYDGCHAVDGGGHSDDVLQQ
jgi:hypothetical protein